MATPSIDAILDRLDSVTAAADSALQGEPARFIGYGAAIVIVGVVALANAAGVTRLGENIDLPTALVLAGTATTTVVGVIESIRKFVFAPKTVAAILDEVNTDVPAPQADQT